MHPGYHHFFNQFDGMGADFTGPVQQTFWCPFHILLVLERHMFLNRSMASLPVAANMAL
jgi:hypothetical protein